MSIAVGVLRGSIPKLPVSSLGCPLKFQLCTRCGCQGEYDGLAPYLTRVSRSGRPSESHNSLFLLLPNPDSYVSGNSIINPLWLRCLHVSPFSNSNAHKMKRQECAAVSAVTVGVANLTTFSCPTHTLRPTVMSCSRLSCCCPELLLQIRSRDSPTLQPSSYHAS